MGWFAGICSWKFSAPVLWGYLPVNRLDLLGLHDEVVTKAFENNTPSFARRSTFGVRMVG